MSDQSEEVQLQLQVERRSFDLKDINLNGALEGSELDAYLNPPDIKWYESEVMYLIGKRYGVCFMKWGGERGK